LVAVAQSFLPALMIPAHCSLSDSAAAAVEANAAPLSASTPAMAKRMTVSCLIIDQCLRTRGQARVTC
jgi:hypothetical protein